MKDEEINIAIAEACGFTNVHRFEKWKEGGPMSDGTLIGDVGGRARVYVPCYTRDLNAMHEAEKIVCRRGHNVSEPLWFSLVDVCGSEIDAAFSTARQRAEAFLRTLGKWQEPATHPNAR